MSCRICSAERLPGGGGVKRPLPRVERVRPAVDARVRDSATRLIMVLLLSVSSVEGCPDLLGFLDRHIRGRRRSPLERPPGEKAGGGPDQQEEPGLHEETGPEVVEDDVVEQ